MIADWGYGVIGVWLESGPRHCWVCDDRGASWGNEIVGRPKKDIRPSATGHSERDTVGVRFSYPDARAIANSSDNVGECSLGLCAGDLPMSLSLSSALRRPRFGLVSGSRARNAKSSSGGTPSRPNSDGGSFMEGMSVQ